MVLSTGASAAKWISRTPVIATIRADVSRRDAAAGHDDDAIAGCLDQRGDRVGTFEYGRLLPEVSTRSTPSSTRVFQRRERIGCHVEGAVEGDRSRPRPRDQPLGRRPRRCWPSRSSTPKTMPSAPAALAASMSASITATLVGRIEEVAAARPDDDVKTDVGDLPRAGGSCRGSG